VMSKEPHSQVPEKAKSEAQTAALALLPDGRAVLDRLGTEEFPGKIGAKQLSGEEVRAAVLVLTAEGMSAPRIAKRIGVSVPDIYYHQRRIREMAARNVRVVDVQEFAGLIELRMERLYERFVSEANIITDPKIRVMALTEARRILVDQVSVLQKMGIIYKEPERVRTEHEVRVRVESITRRFIEVMTTFIPEEDRPAFVEHLKEQQRQLGFSPEENHGGA